MKNSFSNIMAVVMASVVSISILASTQANAATPPEMEAWLKASKLGAYNKNENWSEIVANAKKEGEVVVYTSSGRISKLVKPFNALYPEIELTVHDRG